MKEKAFVLAHVVGMFVGLSMMFYGFSGCSSLQSTKDRVGDAWRDSEVNLVSTCRLVKPIGEIVPRVFCESQSTDDAPGPLPSPD